jgi:ABC-type antimicrobial peptide transport system permease subunit
MAILIAVPPGIAANQAATQNLTGNLGEVIDQTEATINQTLTQIDCSLTPMMDSGPSFSYGPSGGGPVTGGSRGTFVSGGPVSFGGGPFGGGGSKPMNTTYYADLSTISGVAAVVPVLQVVQGHTETMTPHFIANGNGPTPTDLPTFNVTVPDYIINGVPLNSSAISNYPVLPINITAGRNLLLGETGKVLLSENCSAYFGKTVGDIVNILGEDFEVVGIYGPTGVSDRQYAYMDLADAQAITNNTDTVTSFKVFAERSDVISQVANDISAMYPELVVNTAQDRLSSLQQMKDMYDTQLENAQVTLNQTQVQATLVIGIAVTATSIIVLFVMLYTVRERTKEIGTLKAIGASNSTVMGQFLVEGVLLSLVAGAVAVGIGTVAAPFLTSVLLPAVGSTFRGGGGNMVVINGSTSSSASAITISPEFMLIGFGVSVLLGAVGSLYPAWRAAKTRPAEAMRYE